jgi:hypothetical protein
MDWEGSVAVTKGLVCLANSRKYNGRCIAGIDIFDRSNRWIRPVSNRPGEEVSEVERQYRDGTEPRVLDIISVRLARSRPKSFQQENWLLDDTARWQRGGRIGWHVLHTLEERSESLWVNDFHSSGGVNDRVPVEHERALVGSLKLIRVASVTIQVETPYSPSASKRLTMRARFRHEGSVYTLRVTDPVYEQKFQVDGPGEYRLGESFLTVSLAGEEFEGYFYKLVAAIIERAPGSGR